MSREYVALAKHRHIPNKYFLYYEEGKNIYNRLVRVDSSDVTYYSGNNLTKELEKDEEYGYTTTTDKREINKFLMTRELLR